MSRVPEYFIVEGVRVFIPEDLSYIPVHRRWALKSQLRQAYPNLAAEIFARLFMIAIVSVFFLIAGAAFFPLLLGIPIAVLYGLFGDINAKARVKLRKTIGELYAEGYLPVARSPHSNLQV